MLLIKPLKKNMEMKLYMKRNNIVLVVVGVVAIFLLQSCLDKDYSQKEFVGENALIADFLITDPDGNTSLFLEILRKTGYDKLLGTYGTFTVFVPTNDAVDQFLTENGGTTIENIDVDYLVKFVKAHIVNTTFTSFQFKSGTLDDSTLLGNYLVISFAASGFGETYVNKTRKVIAKDIVCSNGIVHKIDHVLEPVLDNIYDYVLKNPDYSIMAQAIKETGYDSLLSLGTYNDEMRRRVERSFTLFIEPDSVMAATGIHTYDELKERYCNTGNPKNKKDSLNLFVGYHILTQRIYANNFVSRNYTTAGYDLMISIVTDNGTVQMNPDSVGDGEFVYVNLIESLTNTDATNGLLHGIDKIMPPKKPVPQTYVLPLFDRWIKSYIDSITGYPKTSLYQTHNTAIKIFARDSANFRGRMEWSINYLGTKAPDANPNNAPQTDDREICYFNQQQVRNTGHFLGSIVAKPEGDGSGNCFWVANYNEYEVTFITDYIVPGKYKVGFAYKTGNRYTLRIIIDDDPMLLDEKASYIYPSVYNAGSGYVEATGQTFIRSLGAIRDNYTGTDFVECQMGTVTFLEKSKHRVKITNMTKYGAPGGNFAQVSLLDYIRFEAVK
jgi:uncharacterized surface protein with fasciclin (FAS1) repeats